MFLERLRNGCAGILHQDVKLTEGRDGLFNRGLDSGSVDASAWMEKKPH
jgi:hypothetical protein